MNLLKGILVLLISIFSVAACNTVPEGGEQSRDRDNNKYTPVSIGILPDTQGDGDAVSIHPMEAVLDKLQESEVDIVIPVGDLTNHGTAFEFDQWTGVA